ncbi:hypothetical protein Mlute_00520 [Meiothermus luteus]|uniref:Uncharacterized protein n=1 Tax=Meiothermus luteus TaxID=2026184 RepID=A0A399F1N6_9DEIN|nr:hypothetical protein Mlute_00520 [Meiothermus luteus]
MGFVSVGKAFSAKIDTHPPYPIMGGCQEARVAV